MIVVHNLIKKIETCLHKYAFYTLGIQIRVTSISLEMQYERKKNKRENILPS